MKQVKSSIMNTRYSREASVLENRARFEEVHQIIGIPRVEFVPFSYGLLDHVELYTTKTGGAVLITSPYKESFDENLAAGFMLTAPLYRKECYTLYIKFASVSALKTYLKDWSI